MIDLNELELLAKAATAGPWDVSTKNLTMYDPFGDSVAYTEQTHNQEANLHYIVAACNAVPELIKRVRELERQKEEAVRYILSNEGASMIDCRMCFFVSSCERGPKQCNPDYEMCKRAVIKAIEEAGE